MGHTIRAIVGPHHVVRPLAETWAHATLISLPQDMAMIMATDALLDELLNRLGAAGGSLYPEFVQLGPALERALTDGSRLGPLAYLETDYFGGTGTQSAILYDGGAVTLGPLLQETTWNGEEPEVGEPAINPVLEAMGVRKGDAYDAFDALTLGSYRRMDG